MKNGFTTKRAKQKKDSYIPFASERWEKNRLRGFTLIETIITIGLSVVAFIALTNLFIIFNTTYGYQQAFMLAAGSASTAMNSFEETILPAEQVLASHSFNGTAYSSSTTTLVLSLPAIDGSGNIISGTKDYAVFYASSTMLYQLTETGAGSVRLSGLKQLSTTLQSLSFIYDDADFAKVASVLVDMTTQAQFKQQSVQEHLREQLHLRNLQPLP